MSPSEPACSLATATIGPRGALARVRRATGRCRAVVPAPTVPGELLQHQLGGVAAAVVPHVDDQAPRAATSRMQVAVQLGPAVGDHVRDVQVADPAAGRPRAPRPGGRPPSPGSAAPARRPAAARRRGAPRRRRRAARSAPPACRRPGQQRRRAEPRVDRPAVDREELVAGPDADARRRDSGDRAAAHRGLAGQHPGDPPAVVGALAGRRRGRPTRPAAARPAAAAGARRRGSVPSSPIISHSTSDRSSRVAMPVDQRAVALAARRPSRRRPCPRSRSGRASAGRSRRTSAATARPGRPAPRSRRRSTSTSSRPGRRRSRARPAGRRARSAAPRRRGPRCRRAVAGHVGSRRARRQRGGAALGEVPAPQRRARRLAARGRAGPRRARRRCGVVQPEQAAVDRAQAAVPGRSAPARRPPARRWPSRSTAPAAAASPRRRRAVALAGPAPAAAAADSRVERRGRGRAASGTRYGRVPTRKDRSKTCSRRRPGRTCASTGTPGAARRG